MAKPAEQIQIEFIVDCLRNGEKRGEIWQKFGKEWQDLSERTFDRRLNQAEAQMEGEISAIVERTEQSVAKEVEARKLKLLSVAERMDILARMASGELEAEKIVFTKDGAKKIKVKPDHTEIKAAIAELNKMDGSYSPVKQDVNITDSVVAKLVVKPASDKKSE